MTTIAQSPPESCKSSAEPQAGTVNPATSLFECAAANPLSLLPKAQHEYCQHLAELHRVPAATIVPAVLAFSASALGGGVSCVIPGRCVPVQFNLLIATDSPVRRLPWLDHILSPIRCLHARLVANRATQRAVERRTQDVAAGQRLDPEIVETLRSLEAEARASLSPCITLSDCSPALILKAIGRCFDSSVSLLDGAQGIVPALISMGSKERTHFARILAQSWDGELLSIGSGVERGRLHLIASCYSGELHDRPVKSLLMGGTGTLPVLVIPEGPDVRSLPSAPPDPGKCALDFYAHAAEFRVRRRPANFCLEDRGYDVVEAFNRQLREAIHLVQPQLAASMTWFPDLAIRFTAILEAMRCMCQLEEVQPLPTETLAGVIEHLVKPLANSHAAVLSRLSGCQPGTQGHAALTDTESRIFRKIAQKPGLSPRELQRALNQMKSPERNQALSRLIRDKWIRVDDAGRLYCV